MADGQKLILGVWDYMTIDKYFRLCFAEFGKGKIAIGGRAMNVTEAIEMIESGAYSGVLMHSLVLSNGKMADVYNKKRQKFERFDNPPNIWRSTGLYVVEQACKKNLITVVNILTEDEKVTREAERLGAKCFNCFGNRAQNVLQDNLEYFLDKLG